MVRSKKNLQTRLREPLQVVAAIKEAFTPTEDDRVCGGTAFVLKSGRLLLTDLGSRKWDLEGVAPGGVNVYFHDAAYVAVKLGIVKQQELDLYYKWSDHEKKRQHSERQLAELQQKAHSMGYELVKKR